MTVFLGFWDSPDYKPDCMAAVKRQTRLWEDYSYQVRFSTSCLRLIFFVASQQKDCNLCAVAATLQNFNSKK
jgi:hypothetical protein